MNYIGKLYGKINNKYFDTGLTSIDWDNQHVDKHKEVYRAAINKWGKEIQEEQKKRPVHFTIPSNIHELVDY